MALVMGRTAFTRIGGMNCWLGKKIHPLAVSKSAPAAPIQVAGLKATYGEKYPYHDPWPGWEHRKYNMIHEWLDNTSKRLNENSKIITVDGNIAVGKNGFAKRLAAGFDLKLIDPVTDRDGFIIPNTSNYNATGYDIRDLNPLLPDSLKFYDLDKFLTDPHPENGMVGRLQVQWFFSKFMAYAHGLHHLLSTGQGFVMVRSPWSDDAFVETLRRMGYVTPKFVAFYNDLRKYAICELLTPHISVYLDAPVNVIQERIKKRARPNEVGSKILSDKYLTTLDAMCKEKVLRRFRQTGHVVEIDWTDEADGLEMEVIIEELQRLDLEPDPQQHSHFLDWSQKSEDMLADSRKYFSSKSRMASLFNAPFPLECPEIAYSDEDEKFLTEVVADHPMFSEKIGESARLGQRNWFGIF